MKVRDFLKTTSMLALALAAATFVAGCNDSDDDDDDSDGGKQEPKQASVVGRWGMVSQEDGGQTWWQFNEDGTFTMFNDEGFSSPHLRGTYTQDGNKVTGPFHNPNVGDGDIDATLSEDGNALNLDFIEHWHSPSKHVLLIGLRL